MLVLARSRCITTTQHASRRFFSNKQGFDSLVLGAYASEKPTLTTQQVSSKTRDLLQSQLALSKFKKAGDVRLFYNVGGIKQVAVVSLGDKSNNKSPHQEQESVRMAVMFQHATSAAFMLLICL
ncbi:hypothetical protein G6F42_024040 [Rhizopus arrhizus]|nr:hypothetical protein G6F42_024040 [Rhizopus arrhizus]